MNKTKKNLDTVTACILFPFPIVLLLTCFCFMPTGFSVAVYKQLYL